MGVAGRSTLTGLALVSITTALPGAAVISSPVADWRLRKRSTRGERKRTRKGGTTTSKTSTNTSKGNRRPRNRRKPEGERRPKVSWLMASTEGRAARAGLTEEFCWDEGRLLYMVARDGGRLPVVKMKVWSIVARSRDFVLHENGVLQYKDSLTEPRTGKAKKCV